MDGDMVQYVEGGGRFYAKSGPRIRAALIDYALCGYLFIAMGLMTDLGWLPGKYLHEAWVVLLIGILFYEPVAVSLFGASFGHCMANIHVCDESTGRKINLFWAMVRYVVKLFLGWISLLTFLVSGKRMAIHDLVTNSSVRIRDIRNATGNICVELDHGQMQDKVNQPSMLRLGLVMIAYMFLSNFLSGILHVLLVSEDCIVYLACNDFESVVGSVLLIMWLLSCFFIVYLGVKGRLFGCRSKKGAC
ncbi:RDD family protein [Chitinimonas sp. JJ19]|uniref:RDD family protein n=1 Tax=Chitinimonas sp. JJ19 TaxID=3109352 RepID=UPI001A37A280|nr:RDD family protein [Chitinimonas sp.]